MTRAGSGFRPRQKNHRRAGPAAITGEHYEGGHWLGSFAAYLTRQRGIQQGAPRAP